MKRPIQLSDHFTYRKLLQFVFPSIVMMIFTSIYGVVDGLFVSNYAGKTAFAAINLVMPFIMVLGGIGFMIGTGGTALVSKILGEGDQEKARRYFSMMILFTVLVGLILTVLGVVFMEPVALFLGATPEMLADCVRYGRIVNVSSVRAFRAAEPNMIAYGVSKLGMHGLTRAFAEQGAPFNVTCNTVAPGMILTENIAKRLTPEKYAEECSAIPMRRGGTAEEIADAVLFPIRNGYVTGETININGGMYYAP